MEGEGLTLDVLTPERHVVSRMVDWVAAPGVEGEFGVLPGHTPFLACLATGVLRYRREGQVRYMAINGGYAEVGPEKVIILTETAELAEEIDVERARAALERAEERLARKTDEHINFERAAAALRRAMTRFKVAELSGKPSD